MKDAKDRIIQFIHESVRDFLLKEDGLETISPDLRNVVTSRSHDRLKQTCQNYVNMDAITSSIIAAAAVTPFLYRRWPRLPVMVKFPFLQYAVQYLLYHAEMATLGGIGQGDFLLSFPLNRWVELNNLLKGEGEYTNTVSLSYVLANQNRVSLIRSCGPQPLWSEFSKER
jgi:hypothetical protein